MYNKTNHPHPEGFITQVKPHTDDIHQTLGTMHVTTLPITSNRLNKGQYKTVSHIEASFFTCYENEWTALGFNEINMKTDILSLIDDTKFIRLLLSSFWAESSNNINNNFAKQMEQAVAINGNNIPPLWSSSTFSRNIQEIDQIFGLHRAEIDGRNTKMNRDPETQPNYGKYQILNALDKQYSKKGLQKPHFRPNIWPLEGQNWW